MKKVGILTFHFANNYGAILQAYALKEVLLRMGYDVIFINRYYKPCFLKRLYINFRVGYNSKERNWLDFAKSRDKLIQPVTPYYSSYDASLKINYQNYHAIITGSDQVWRYSFSHIGYGYYLDFVTNPSIRKVSYAASFGNKEWTENNAVTENIKGLLYKFSAISVRETSGVEICKNIFGVNAKHVLDPTLLLDSFDYTDKILNNYVPERDYSHFVVSYLLANNQVPEVMRKLNYFANSNGCQFMDLYFIDSANTNEYGILNKVHVRLEEWLYAIKTAKYIVTNSFHATVFSILFKKQFVVLESNGHRSSRISSLLNSLSISGRYVTLENISAEQLRNEIDYSTVYKRLSTLRTSSYGFLKDAL